MTLASDSAARRTARPHVVAEHEERAADREDAAVQRPCRSSTPPMPCSRTPKWIWRPAGVVGRLHAVVLEHGAGVAGEVGAAADEAGHDVGERLEARRRWPCGWRPSRPAPRWAASSSQPGRPAAGRGRRRARRGRRSQASSRFSHASRSARPRAPALAVELEHVVGHVERSRRAGGPRIALVARDLVVAERVAVGLAGVGELAATGSRCGCAG